MFTRHLGRGQGDRMQAAALTRPSHRRGGSFNVI
jgi:hypothetical protein